MFGSRAIAPNVFQTGSNLRLVMTSVNFPTVLTFVKLNPVLVIAVHTYVLTTVIFSRSYEQRYLDASASSPSTPLNTLVTDSIK